MSSKCSSDPYLPVSMWPTSNNVTNLFLEMTLMVSAEFSKVNIKDLFTRAWTPLRKCGSFVGPLWMSHPFNYR